MFLRNSILFLSISLLFGQQNILSIPGDSIESGDTLWLSVELDNNENVYGIQFDISYSDEFTFFDEIVLSDRLTGYSIVTNAINGGLRVMLYDADLLPIYPGEGNLLMIGFHSEPIYGNFHFDMIDPLIGNYNGENIITGFNGGIVSLTSLAPILSALNMVTIDEDEQFLLLRDSLEAHTADYDTPIDDILYEFDSEIFSITQQGQDFLISPLPDWHGLDSLKIIPSDGQYYSIAYLSINVIPVNDPPVINPPDNLSMEEDGSLTIELGDHIVDVDDEIVDIFLSAATDIEDVFLNITGSQLTVTSSQDYFSYDITISLYAEDDEGASATSQFELDILSVNDQPTLLDSLPSQYVNEDDTLHIQVASFYQIVNDVDNAFEDLVWTIQNGQFISSIISDGVITIIPNSDWFGTEELLMFISDGVLETSSKIEINVVSINDAPVVGQLLEPLDGHFQDDPYMSFSWESPYDVDGDILSTDMVFIHSDGVYSYSVESNPLEMNVFAYDLPFGEQITWYVTVADQDTVVQSEMRQFQVSDDLEHTGPIWYVDTEGHDQNGNGSNIYPHKTVQASVDAASAGDTILVAMGTYPEPVIIEKYIHLIGAEEFGQIPTLIGSEEQGIVQLIGLEEDLFFAENIRFLNGQSSLHGGAISSANSPIWLKGCSFIGNTADSKGGALYGGNALIEARDCIFESNLARNGGAIYSKDIQLDSCTFALNQASQMGGALALIGLGVVQRSLFDSNQSIDGGGAIRIDNIASGNEQAVKLINNTIYNNVGSVGGAIYVEGQVNVPIMINTIVWGNISLDETNSLSSIFGVMDITYSNVEGGISGLGNMDENPLFHDPGQGQFALLELSPCIDAGHPDLDGDGIDWQEDIDDQDPDSSRMDIGAYTYLGPDTTAPTVSVLHPNGGEIFGTGNIKEILWQSEDDRSLQWTKIYLSMDGGNNFEFLDSLGAENSIQRFDYSIPVDQTTNEGLIMVEVSDWGDNLSMDVSDDYFFIVDSTDPNGSILLPNDSSFYNEYDEIEIVWQAQDNISLDSVYIYYSNEPLTFIEVGRVDFRESSYGFTIPLGVTDAAQIKLTIFDTSGNYINIFSAYFSVFDNTPPNVQLMHVEDLSISEVYELEWLSTDNTELSYHQLYYSQGLSEDFIYIDSVGALNSHYDWLVPNFVSESARIYVRSFDIVGLSSSDTSNAFLVIDTIPPLINIIIPNDTTSVPENEILTLQWTASDNILLDSLNIYYSTDGGQEYILINSPDIEFSSFDFLIPTGVTENALVRFEAFDSYGNSVNALSDNFFVTDNTPPIVDIVDIEPVSIGEVQTIEWVASDNESLRSHHLYLSQDSLSDFFLYDSVDGSIISYNWLVPNFVSYNARFIIESFDMVGLSSTDTSNSFQVTDTIAPTIHILSPMQGESVLEGTTLNIQWFAEDNIALDSLYIYYSFNGGQEYQPVTGLGALDSIYPFQVPIGITNTARVMIEVNDSYGNSSSTVSHPFSVTDNTAPLVELMHIEPLYIGDIYPIAWLSEDNGGFDYHLLYYSQSLSSEYVFIDTVNGYDTTYNWLVPNFISDEATLKIEIFDLAGLSTIDTSNTFLIMDNIPPSVEVNMPNEYISVREYDSLTVSWSADDNIALDSVQVDYRSSFISNFSTLFRGTCDVSEVTVTVPQGISQESMVRVTVMDNSGNSSADTSEIFTVTDNTAPEVVILVPTSGIEVDIGSELSIDFESEDNLGVATVLVSYKTPMDSDFIDIGISHSSDSSITWFVPNKPTDNAQIRAIATDQVGLMDTNVVSNIFINIVYPTIESTNPHTGSINFLTSEILFQFSEPMDENSFSDDGISILSAFPNELDIYYNYNPNSWTLSIGNPTGFTSLDSIEVRFDGNVIRSSNGYELDGDNDGIGGDNIIIPFNVGISCDLNDDGQVGASDLIIFEQAWESKQFSYELGPYLGQVPYTMIQPDSAFDIEDVMAFVLNVNWYLENMGLRISENNIKYSKQIFIDRHKECIEIDLPRNTSAYELIAQHSSGFGFQKVEQSSISSIAFNDTANHRLQIMSMNENGTIVLPYQIGNGVSEIQLYIKLFSSDGLSIGNFSERLVIEPLPSTFSLEQNYPNPFNPETKIDYSIPVNSSVKLVIFDILGKEVVTLVNKPHDAGYKSVIWNGKDSMGRYASAGIYFYSLSTDFEYEIKKMVLLK